MLTDNFNSVEFECSCSNPLCVEQRISKELVANLQAIRSTLSIDIVVLSGFRCEWKQAELKRRGYKTARKSQHLLGNAADVQVRPHNRDKFNNMIDTFFVAKGWADSWVHVDMREDKERIWYY